jgi:uncharacterized protein YprB with RNaseH-like and TPR domain
MDTMIPSGTNFHRLNKDAIIWLYDNYCRHGHRYTEHPTCFAEEWEGKLSMAERAVVVDIEATNLQADFGYIICYSLKEKGGDIIHRCVTPEEIWQHKFDKGVMKQFVKDIKGYTRLIVYYGGRRRFDIPYLRTRALRWGIPFPTWKEYMVTDVFDLVKPMLRLHRNRLECAADLLDIPSKQHRLNPEVWMKGQAGDKRSLDYIQTHCDEDVVTLEQVYDRLCGFRGQDKTSI